MGVGDFSLRLYQARYRITYAFKIYSQTFYEIKKRIKKIVLGKYSQPPGSAGSRAMGSILVDSTNSGLKIFGKNYVYRKSLETFLLLFAIHAPHLHLRS